MSGSTGLRNIESIAIGAFDGIHKAHQELIGRADAVVVIDKGDAILTPGRYRCEFVKRPCFFFELSKIRHMDAKAFVALLRKSFPNLKKIVVGYDFAFGKDRKYSIEDLRHHFEGEVEVVPEVMIDGVSVHSRTIKDLLRRGQIAQANKLLGRCYMIEGEVVPGQGIGKKELVPTINLSVEKFLLPKEGVYATLTQIGENLFASVSFIGHRVTTDGSFAVETHILDAEPPHAKRVRIYFIERIRDNRKFASLQKLKAAIATDIEKARRISRACLENSCCFA